MSTHPTYQLVFPSPIGFLTLESNDTHLTALRFGHRDGTDSTPLLLEAQSQLNAFFAGNLQVFTLPLAYQGTDFQNRVWTELRTIPFGSTISYRELAERVNCPKGYQAVGSANGRNPLPIFIPCHRVIAHSGGLGGYSGGLAAKSILLDLEKRRT